MIKGSLKANNLITSKVDSYKMWVVTFKQHYYWG